MGSESQTYTHIKRCYIFEQDLDGRIIRSTEQSEPKIVSEIVRDNDEAENENQLVDENDDGNNDNNNADEEFVFRDEENVRRSERARRPPEREGIIAGNWWEFTEDALYSCADNILGEPKSIDEALNSPARNDWKKALDDEFESLTMHNTWTLVKLPENRNVIDSKWVFKTKYNADGTVDRY